MNTPIHMWTSIDEFCKDDFRGISCQFVPMTNTVGLKLYFNKYDGKKAYALQKLASLHGLGPKCWKRFDFRGGYGFFTEILEPVSREEWCDYTGSAYRIYFPRHPYHDVYLQLKKIGIVDCDGHAANYGRNANGQVMLLDFGGFGCNTCYKGKL